MRTFWAEGRARAETGSIRWTGGTADVRGQDNSPCEVGTWAAKAASSRDRPPFPLLEMTPSVPTSQSNYSSFWNS